MFMNTTQVLEKKCLELSKYGGYQLFLGIYQQFLKIMLLLEMLE